MYITIRLACFCVLVAATAAAPGFIGGFDAPIIASPPIIKFLPPPPIIKTLPPPIIIKAAPIISAPPPPLIIKTFLPPPHIIKTIGFPAPISFGHGWH